MVEEGWWEKEDWKRCKIKGRKRGRFKWWEKG